MGGGGMGGDELVTYDFMRGLMVKEQERCVSEKPYRRREREKNRHEHFFRDLTDWRTLQGEKDVRLVSLCSHDQQLLECELCVTS
jgi:hypothetical protein